MKQKVEEGTGLRPFTERRRRIDASVVKDKIYYLLFDTF